MTYREEQFMKQMTEIAIEVAELRAENKLLKSFNDSLLQALHKPVVVRGGAFENQSLHHDKDLLKHTDEQLTTNAPTEPLQGEAMAKGVSGWPKVCKAESNKTCEYPSCYCPEITQGV